MRTRDQASLSAIPARPADPGVPADGTATPMAPAPATAPPLGPETRGGRLGRGQLVLLLLLLGSAMALALAWLLAGAGTALATAFLLLGLSFLLIVSGRLDLPRSDVEDNRRLAAMLALLDGPAALTDMEGRILASNPPFQRLCGRARSIYGARGLEEHVLKLQHLSGQARLTGLGAEQVAATLHLHCRPLEGPAGRLVWRIQPLGGQASDGGIAAAFSGPTGAWLGERSILAAVLNERGQVTCANARFWEFVGEEPASGAERLPLSAVLRRPGGRDQAMLRRADGRESEFRCSEQAIDLPCRNGKVELVLFAPPALSLSGGPFGWHAAELAHRLPFALAVLDAQGRFAFMNQAFIEVSQLPEPTSSLVLVELAVPEDRAELKAHFEQCLEGPAGASWRGPVRLASRPGVNALLSLTALGPPQERWVTVLLEDDSERLRLERQVHQTSKMQAVGQLAGGIAHDFNNILTAVIGMSDLMLMRHTPGDADFDDISQIRQNAHRGANLVRQLLAFSRQQRMHPQILDVSDVLGELSHLLKRLLGETIRLRVRHGRDLAPVRADPGQLEQVIVNLAVNARDALPQGGTLTIETRNVPAAEVRMLNRPMMPVAEYVLITVADNGVGMSPEVMGQIFEPFFTTKEVGRGTGLGLATVYGIIKQTGGFIFVKSEAGCGATFSIYLPASGEARSQLRASAREAPPRDGSAAPWDQGRIIVAEDEVMVRKVIERALTRKGYEVHLAENGEEALALLEAQAGADLLVSDVVMPVMGGPALVARARLRFPELPVLLMSGYAEEHLHECLDEPGVTLLNKPFDVHQLTEAVRQQLAYSRHAAEKTRPQDL